MARKEKDLKEALMRFTNDSKSIEEKLKRWLGGFNLFEILDITRAEIRHSSFLAWMMDPRGIHEMGGEFLMELFHKLAENPANREKDYSFLKNLDLESSSVKVEREYSNSDFDKKVRIDIRVVIYDLQYGETVVVIENKIGAGERETEEDSEEIKKGQLKDYVELTDAEFPQESKKIFVFLTPDGRKPENADDSTIWGVLSYEDVVQCLMSIREELKNRSSGTFREKVLFLVDNYIQCLRRHVVKDVELIKTCKELYAQHHEAIECIKKTIDEEKARVISKARELINQTLKEISAELNSNLIWCSDGDANGKNPTFQTKTLNQYLPLLPTGTKGSWGNRAVYLYWFHILCDGSNVEFKVCLEFGGEGLEEGSDIVKRMAVLYKKIKNKDFELSASSGKKKGKPRKYHQTWDWKIHSKTKSDLDTKAGCHDFVQCVRTAVSTAMDKERKLLDDVSGNNPKLFRN